MISSIYKIILNSKNKWYYLIVYRIFKVILNIFYPIIIKFYSVRPKNSQNNVIVSLTSFPSRINSVWLTIETLLRQTYKPEKIILWLANTQFSSIEELPKRLINQQKRGLEIRFCDDLRSHKKYYYSMLKFPEHIVITVDDDTFYPEDLVEKLIEAHNKYPEAICCNIGHLITFENNEVSPYKKWESGADNCTTPTEILVPIGCEGVLYPPGSLHHDVFDKEKIKNLCPIADDLWLKSMATLKGTKAFKANSSSFNYVNLISANKDALNKINVNQNMNDKQLNNILIEYPEILDKWKSEVRTE